MTDTLSYLAIHAGYRDDGVSPVIVLEVGLPDAFSRTDSIQMLFWKVDGQQTWVTVDRVDAGGLFRAAVDLPLDASAGDYAIRAVYAQDNDGNFQWIGEQDLAGMGFELSASLINNNADTIAPEMTHFDVVADYLDDAGNTHVVFSIGAQDTGTSGLEAQFLLELLSPDGQSLQQWAYFDEYGQAKVDFELASSAAPGAYQVNTVRIADMAGNMNLHQDWLLEHPCVIKVAPAPVELIGVVDTAKAWAEVG